MAKKKPASETLSADEKIVQEAQERWESCREWESTFRPLFKEDLKFDAADSDNRWQWPQEILTIRDGDSAPCLTINKTHQHNLQIINDAKQNKPGVIIRPSGGGATYKSAQVYNAVVRHIEYRSSAEQAYDNATGFQVKGGIGYWRVITDYLDSASFDQEVLIKPIPDPMSVYLDRDIKQRDGSDARYGFIFDDIPRDRFKLEYPELADDMPGNVPMSDHSSWVQKDYVRIAEYYRIIETKDTLIAFTESETQKQVVMRGSQLPRQIRKAILDDPDTQSRDILRPQLQWFKIAGNKIIDRTEPKGMFIPIVRVVGEETIIDGKLDRKGHTRAMKDPQRMYNYWTSGATQYVALQSKIPYVGPARAFEGYEQYWDNANTENFAYLPYNDVDDAGQPVQAPQRQEPPQGSQAFLAGMQTASQEMMMVSGQYEASFGQKGNERSGKAINERQRQGDTATYHFIDGLAIAIRYTGRILIDLIPQIYDTPRVLMMMGEDGMHQSIKVDPNMPADKGPLIEMAKTKDSVEWIFNPKVGIYDVVADVGPAYATRRQEAWNAFEQIVTMRPELTNIIGDIMFKNADFPGADVIAERLKRMVPAQAMEDGPPPEVAAMQQQLQASQKVIEELVAELSKAHLDLKGKQIDAKNKTDDIQIQRFNAETAREDALSRRITAVSNAEPELGDDVVQPIVQQTIASMLSEPTPAGV